MPCYCIMITGLIYMYTTLWLGGIITLSNKHLLCLFVWDYLLSRQKPWTGGDRLTTSKWVVKLCGWAIKEYNLISHRCLLTILMIPIKHHPIPRGYQGASYLPISVHFQNKYSPFWKRKLLLLGDVASYLINRMIRFSEMTSSDSFKRANNCSSVRHEFHLHGRNNSLRTEVVFFKWCARHKHRSLQIHATIKQKTKI